MRILGVVLSALTLGVFSAAALGQQIDAPAPQRASIHGTVTDVQDASVPGATVTVTSSVSNSERTVITNETGWFEVNDLDPRVPYHVTVRASGFGVWTSPPVVAKPGQALEVEDIKLKISVVETTVVAMTQEQLARQQVTALEHQRVLGVIPNFFVSYDKHPVPLTTKLKYELSFKAATDIVSIAGDFALAGINQAAATTPDYQQGAKGYAQRFGASYAQSFSNVMLGGAVLPSLLHQDPRYFYQGEGTGKSRAMHALSSPFICKGDNGHSQFNFSSVGGDLISGAMTNAYFPPSNRGPGLVFYSALINTGGRVANALVQEFILAKYTKK
ncbi:MAG: carboxypeptidase-like regulatory domain-containing protein [Acidobacteriaceae bacterium]